MLPYLDEHAGGRSLSQPSSCLAPRHDRTRVISAVPNGIDAISVCSHSRSRCLSAVSHMSVNQNRKSLSGLRVHETATRKEVSDKDDIIARLETRILARYGSMVSGARTCSEWMVTAQKRARVRRSRTRGQHLHCFGSLYCSQPAGAAESNSLTTCMQPINQAIY